MDTRELKALEIAARMRITWEDGAWSVPSASGQGTYRVVLKKDGKTCTCPNHELTGKDCKHVLAALFVRERDHAGEALLINTSTLPEKKTYKQDWPEYNEAQMTEKRRFLALLHDLCRGIEEPPQPKTGRRRTLLKDMLAACCLKVYTTLSSRRFACDLEDAYRQGYLTHLMHSVHTTDFMDSELLTPALHALIVRSSLPLKAVEVDFATDSTGFTTSRFHRWYDHKYNAMRQEHDWVKAHFTTGVKTNIVTAVVILDRDAGDSPQLPELAKKTAENFTIREMSLDKAYLSHENLELIAGLGGTAYVPFKNNSVAGEAGSLWERMFHYFNFRREEFLAHYHKRSNVESTVSMVKAKFRDHVRSKTDTAMKNEVLCKFLCHNLCVVHQSHVELGIEPVFWPDEPKAEGPAVLPMIRKGG